MREGGAWVHESSLPEEQKQKLMERLEQAVWSFPRSVTRHLLAEQEDQADFVEDCRSRLRPDLVEDLAVARHKPTRSLYELSCAINEFRIGGGIDERRVISMDHSVTVLCDAMGPFKFHGARVSSLCCIYCCWG
jgi:ion channel-forming bestrophin family protein